MSQRAVKTAKSQVKIKGDACFDSPLHLSLPQFQIFWMDQSGLLFGGGCCSRWWESEDAEKFFRPSDDSGCCVQFPIADVGESLGFFELPLAVADGGFGDFAIRNVE